MICSIRQEELMLIITIGVLTSNFTLKTVTGQDNSKREVTESSSQAVLDILCFSLPIPAPIQRLSECPNFKFLCLDTFPVSFRRT